MSGGIDPNLEDLGHPMLVIKYISRRHFYPGKTESMSEGYYKGFKRIKNEIYSLTYPEKFWFYFSDSGLILLR